MVTVIFEAHSTSTDNENNVASGWADSRLSPLGIDQSKQMSQRYAGQQIDAVFCSDLKRSYQTATLAFDFNPKLIYMDWRLRECDYGDLTQGSRAEVDAAKASYITQPFPYGESYEQCVQRIRSFLTDLKARWDGRTIIVIGHRATQYGLEHLLNGKPLEQCITEPWQWQPGWKYRLQ